MAGNALESTVPGRILVLILFSAVFGLGVHLAALRGPLQEIQWLKSMHQGQLRSRVLSPVASYHGLFLDLGGSSKAAVTKLVTNPAAVWTARSTLGLDPSHSALGAAADWVFDYLFVLLALFQHFLESRLGKALLIGIAGHMFPLVVFMMTEPLKATRASLFPITWNVLVLSAGQVMCVGAAAPLFWIPVYALGRIAEAKSLPHGVYPLAAPPASVLGVQAIANVLAFSSVLICALLPVSSPYFFYANVYFQVFPLFYLPLALYTPLKAVLGGGSGAQAREQTTRAQKSNHLVHLYGLLAYVCLGMQAAAFYLAYPSLQPLGRALLTFARELRSASSFAPAHVLALAQGAARPALSNDGEWLLLVDMLGVATCIGLVVLIDDIVDEWIVRGGALAASTKAGELKEERTKRRVARLHEKTPFLQSVSWAHGAALHKLVDELCLLTTHFATYRSSSSACRSASSLGRASSSPSTCSGARQRRRRRASKRPAGPASARRSRAHSR